MSARPPKDIDALLGAAKAYLEGERAGPPSLQEPLARKSGQTHATADLDNTVLASASAPIRTVHHLSCTGGTLITKCIAAMPNTLVLNEVDPLSLYPVSGDKPRFSPTDMIALLRQGDPEIGEDLITRVFQAEIACVLDEMTRIGRATVLRDHSHTHFLTGPDISDRLSVLEILKARIPTLSVVTVRNPIDSFLSVQANKWHLQFEPSTFEEYCRRYLAFLDRYEGLPLFKYEDFVADPQKTMQAICNALDLEYADNFTELFNAFRFSGDSGRSSAIIEPRAHRDGYDELHAQVDTAPACRTLMDRLAYKKTR